MYSETAYRFVGGLQGYVLCPLALTGFATPLYVHFFAGARLEIGIMFLVISVLIAIANVHLCSRREVIEKSASYFPAFFSMAGMSAWYLIAPVSAMFHVLAGILILLFDFLGQPLFGAALARMTNH